MKKFASFVMIMCLLLSIVPPCSAAEAYDPAQEALLQEAREVFPEYSSQLHLSQGVGYSAQTLEDDYVVFSETRSVSENETISLMVMRSGYVRVLNSFADYRVSSAGSSASQVGSDVIGNATFTITCNAVIGTFSISNIGFIIHQNKTGYFTSYGTAKATGGNEITTTSRTTTKLHYGLRFNADGASPFNMAFECYFDNGQVIGQLL